jgi:hypothetical protein
MGGGIRDASRAGARLVQRSQMSPLALALVLAAGLGQGESGHEIAPLALHARALARTDAPAEADVEAAAPGVSIEDAIEAGELTMARETATATREADPNIETWRTEGAVLEAMADWSGAREAYTAAIELARSDEKMSEVEELEQRLDRVEAASRGTVADEPESTHRERLDRERAERNAPPTPEPVAPEPEPEPERDDRIVKKWYFWVTIGAIAASGAAIAGLAIKNGIDEQAMNSEALVDAATSGGVDRFPRAPALFRF